MARVNLPNINKAEMAVGVVNGGTGQQSLGAAALALSMVTTADIGTPNGPAALDANGQISANMLTGGVSVNGVNINSTFAVMAGQTLTLKISDFDSFKTYVVSVSAGSYTMTGDTITYTAPATAQTATITINGRAMTIAVIAIQPQQPVITSPVNNSVGLGSGLSLTSSAFVPVGDASTHTTSDWQIASDAAFINIVTQSANDAINKTSWSVTLPAPSTTYYVRVRYKSSAGNYSDWSATTAITTKTSFVISSEEAKLLPGDGTNVEYFGTSVSVTTDGSRIVVSSPYKTGTAGAQQGAVYIFLRTGVTWTQEAKLLAGDPAASDQFGISVSIAGDGSRVVVGAQNKFSYQGAAYVFTRTNTIWTQEAKLVVSDPSNNDQFGNAVSVTADGTRVIIGAYYKTGSANNQGAAYIFLRTGTSWTQETKLLASNASGGDQFGFSVSITPDGSRVAIGANRKTVSISLQGEVYVFLRTGVTWAEEAKLVVTTPGASDSLGNAVSITADGSRVIAGASNSKVGSNPQQGAAYIFLRTGTSWTQEAKLVITNPASNDYFGNAVSITADGSRAAIGAFQKSGTAGATQGAVYVFLRTGVTWTQEAKLLAGDPGANDAFGYSVSITADGSRVVIGANNKVNTGGVLGAVYVDA